MIYGELFDHINKQHPNIKFTSESEDQDNSLFMLDLKLTRTDNSIVTDIDKKPTHRPIPPVDITPPGTTLARHR